jgi:FkbM family methyltransferase
VNFNKVCEIEDFADPELVGYIREVCAQKAAFFPPDFPAGHEARKDWEVAMSVRALRHFGALHPDALVLGVAAGTEDTIFYLTRHARQVFVTDRYLGAGAWGQVAPVAMLVDPGFLAPFDFDPNRLVVQHMDGRSLRYPDETFDAVFSSGSIEHFGELLDVAYAAYEMGRVLKPGGILVLSTEFKIDGPPEGIGWPGDALMLSAENLRRYIVEASGLEPVDALETDLSEPTLATARDISQAVLDHDRRLNGVGARGVPEYALWDFPHLVMSHGGYEFTSVHLTLRRPAEWPAVDNAWARPPRETLDAIAGWNAQVLAAGDPSAAAAAVSVPEPQPVAGAAVAPSAVAEEAGGDVDANEPELPAIPVSAAAGTWDERRAAVTTLVDVAVEHRRVAGGHLGGVLGLVHQAHGQLEGIDRDAAVVDRLIPAAARLRDDAARRPRRAAVDGLRLAPPGGPGDRSTWKRCRANLGGDASVVVMVDRSSDDPITAAVAHGETPLFKPLVELMLALTRPGELVVDLGAHIGTFALAAAGAGRRAVAVEASPVNAALLRASVVANKFWDLRVVNAAVGDTPGTVDFWSRGPWGHVATPEDGAVSEPVAAVTVDSILYELGLSGARFVKMDVEGCEPAAVRGMRPLLEPDDAPTLLYEANGHTLALFGETPESLVAALDDLGYTSYYIDYVVDPHLLVRVEPGVMQPETLVDCLAVKERPESPPGWRFAPPMTLDQRVQRMVADCLVPNPDHRAYLARRLREAGPEVLNHPALAATLAALVVDPADAVREAAAWLRPATA